jgi:hypothetical protein
METMNINKWQARIEKRRNDGAVLAYVDGLIQQRHVSLEDVTSFLTSDELQEVRNTVTERVKREAEEKAREEADRAERERKAEENRRLIAAFYEQNPPLPPTTVPEIKTESELFDVLARYHIAKVECSFEARYHWEELECIEYLIPILHQSELTIWGKEVMERTSFGLRSI